MQIAGQANSIPKEAQKRQKALKTLVQQFSLNSENSNSSQLVFIEYLRGISYNLHVPKASRKLEEEVIYDDSEELEAKYDKFSGTIFCTKTKKSRNLYGLVSYAIFLIWCKKLYLKIYFRLSSLDH